MDCETNDCRKEKRGCKGCYYDKNFDNSYDYILKLNTREELIEHSLKLLDELENKDKKLEEYRKFHDRRLKGWKKKFEKQEEIFLSELDERDKDLETWKKIAEKLADELEFHYDYEYVCFIKGDYGQCREKKENSKTCKECLLDWARKEVFNDK